MNHAGLDLLKSLEAVFSSIGDECFRALVQNLTLVVGVDHAFVAQFAGSPSRVRTRAFWGKGRWLDNVEYELAGTPCESVVSGAICHHSHGVQQAFPQDRLLADLAVESYLGAPLRDSAGTVLGHIALMHTEPLDDDARRLSILELFASYAASELERLQLRDLFEEAPIAYVYEDSDTRFVSANRAAIRLLGLKPEEVRGTVGRSLLPPTTSAHGLADDIFADIQQGKERGSLEFELRRKDNGKPIWVQFWSRPEPDGKHTRTMLIDITDRVLAEQEQNRLRQQNNYLREEIKTEHNFEEIIGSSPSLQEALQKVKQVAPTDSTVLILGETGSGKELIARAIHNNSPRKVRPLIKLNCAALPTGLIESELFGHEKGAFTGALEKRIGRFALADGGTIFLDEIGEIPAEVQLRLLRVLQEYEFEPVGSPHTIKVNVRVIAAANRDLETAIASGSFRPDLFYRLNVFPIRIPPLRERREDIPMLVHYFTGKYAAKIGKRIDSVEAATMERLIAYAWPGNIRELQNVIERAVILSEGDTLEVEPAVLGAPPPAKADERDQILRTLDEKGWVIEGDRGAAKSLGLHPNTLRSRMKKLGIKRERA